MNTAMPPPILVIAQIVAMDGDPRPGVTRLAIEALCALSGLDLPRTRHEPLVRRPYKPTRDGVQI